MGVYGFVDLRHEGLGLGDGDEHALVVAEVIGGEGAAAAVFEFFRCPLSYLRLLLFQI